MGSRSDHAYCNRYLRNRPPNLNLGSLRCAPTTSWHSSSVRDFSFFPKMPPDRLVSLGPTSFSAAVFCLATSAYLAAKGVLRSI